jgi:hypothetical protein
MPEGALKNVALQAGGDPDKTEISSNPVEQNPTSLLAIVDLLSCCLAVLLVVRSCWSVVELPSWR